jgi:uncharacterized membrane protein
MADFASPGANSDGIAYLVSAGIVFEIIAAACSSPQTTEINASSRAGTLMKWVYVGLIQAAIFVAVAAWIDSAHRAAIIAGGMTAAITMWASYVHAKSAGLRNCGPATEH